MRCNLLNYDDKKRMGLTLWSFTTLHINPGIWDAFEHAEMHLPLWGYKK